MQFASVSYGAWQFLSMNISRGLCLRCGSIFNCYFGTHTAKSTDEGILKID